MPIYEYKRPDGSTFDYSNDEAALAAIEARQLAFVEKLTRYADQRADRSAWRATNHSNQSA